MRVRICAAMVVAAGLAATAQAGVTYGFFHISNNSGQAAQVAQQLWVEVDSPALGVGSFRFTNNVGIASSITDIYFDNSGGVLNHTSSVISQSAGVSFSSPATPPSLPGGANHNWTTHYSADSDSPISANGVNAAAEWVQFNFNLANAGWGLPQILQAINTGGLRFGLHVQSIGTSGNSDAFINVPAPAAILLGLMGLGGTSALRRKLG